MADNPGSKPKLEVSQHQLLAALRSYEEYGGAKLSEIISTVAPALDLGGGGAFIQRQRFAELYDLPDLERRLRKIAVEDPDGLWIAKATATRSPNPSARQVRTPTREDWKKRRKDLIEEHGLDKFYSFYYPDERHLAVDLISVPKAVRGSGHASMAMKDTLAWADRNGVTVTLSPTSEFGASKKRLEKWYRSLGFVPNKGRNKDFRFTDAMIREPRPVTPRARRLASKLSSP